MRLFVILRETAVPTTSLHPLSSPRALHSFWVAQVRTHGGMLRMHLHLADSSLAVFFWAAVQMVWTETKQPQKQTVIQRSRQTQLPLSLHIPGWNPIELTWARTGQADQDPRNTLLGLEKAGTENFCHVSAHQPPWSKISQADLYVVPGDFFQALRDLLMGSSPYFLNHMMTPLGVSGSPSTASTAGPVVDTKQCCSRKTANRTHVSILVCFPQILSMRDGCHPYKKTKGSKESASGFFQNLPN